MGTNKGAERRIACGMNNLEAVRIARLMDFVDERDCPPEAGQLNIRDDASDQSDDANDNDAHELGGDDETYEQFAAKLKIMEEREDELMAHVRQMLNDGENDAPRVEVGRHHESDDEEPGRRAPQPMRLHQLGAGSPGYGIMQMRMISEQDAELIAEVHALMNEEDPAAQRRNRSQQDLAELMAELNAMPNNGNGPSMPRGPVFRMSLPDFLYVADDDTMDGGEDEEENGGGPPPPQPAAAAQGETHNFLFFPDYSVVMDEQEDEEERIATNNFNAALENFFNMRAEQGLPAVTLGRDLLNFLEFFERGE